MYRRDNLVARGLDHRVPHAGDRVAAAVQLGEEGRAHLLLDTGHAGCAQDAVDRAEQPERLAEAGQPAECGAVVGRRDPHKRVNLRRAAEELEVVAGHHATLRVPDNVDLGRPCRGEHTVHERRQLPGRRRDLPGRLKVVGRRATAIVEREDAIAVIRENRGRRLPVVVHVLDGPVHEHDWIRVRRARPAGEVVGAGRGNGRFVISGQECARETVVDRQAAERMYSARRCARSRNTRCGNTRCGRCGGGQAARQDGQASQAGGRGEYVLDRAMTHQRLHCGGSVAGPQFCESTAPKQLPWARN